MAETDVADDFIPETTGSTALASTFADRGDLERYRRARWSGASVRQALSVGDNGIGAWGDNTTRMDDPIVALPRDTPGLAHNRQVEVTGPDGRSVVARVADKMPATANLQGRASIDLNPGAAAAIGHTGGVRPVSWRYVDSGSVADDFIPETPAPVADDFIPESPAAPETSKAVAETVPTPEQTMVSGAMANRAALGQFMAPFGMDVQKPDDKSLPFASEAEAVKSADALQARTPKIGELPANVLPPEVFGSWVGDAVDKLFPWNETAQTISGFIKGIAQGQSDMTEKTSLPLLALGPSEAAASKLVGAAFLGQQILGTPDQVRAFNSAKTKAEKAKIAGQMVIGYGAPALGFLGHGKPVDDFIPETKGGDPNATATETNAAATVPAAESVAKAGTDNAAAAAETGNIESTARQEGGDQSTSGGAAVSSPATPVTEPEVNAISDVLNAPKLRPGEKQGDLLSTQTEDLKLVGEKGVDFSARQAEADRVAAEKVKAQQAQDQQQKNLFGQTEEEAQREHEAELLADYQEHNQRSGDELLDAVESGGGLPALSSDTQAQWKGELENIRQAYRAPTRKDKMRYSKIFKKDAPDVDKLTQHLITRGFDVETPADTLQLIHDRIFNGKPIYANEARGSVAEIFGFGPGAAAEGEFGAMGRKPIRIANADIDAERATRGAEPLMSEARKPNPVLWDETMSQLDRTPQAGRILVDNINAGEVKSTSPVQQTMLLHEEISLRNEKAMEAERAVDPNSTEEERADARAKFSALEARIDATERAGRKAGSIAGSALQARQIAAFDDYTYAALETRTRNAKGRPLTIEESAKLKTQAAEIERLKTELGKAQDQGVLDRQMETFSNLVREHLKESKAQVKAGKSVLDRLHEQRDAALKRSAERRRQGRLYTGVDPEAVLDAVIVGASHIADGIKVLADWSKAMVRDFGEAIRPHLEQLFSKAQEYHDAHANLVRKPKVRPTPIEKIAGAASEKSGLTNRMVFELAREHVRAGVEGLDKVMAATHADLEPHFPGLTERQVRDMFTDYGKVRFPSKQADLAALRDYRRQGQLVSALEDAQSGLSPKKTGLQRDQPSKKVLELQKQVQDAMREAGITTASDPTRLKTNLDRYKTLLDNKLVDVNRRLAEADYSKPTRRATVLDKEAANKKALLNQALLKLDQQIERQRLENRSFGEKFQDASVKWARTAKLLSPRVFPKLIEAGLIRIVTNPISRGLSQPLRLIPGFSEKAPAQLRVGARAEAKRVAAILSSGPAAWRKLIGKSELDALTKKKLLDSEMSNLVGNMHGMIKEPVRQGEYAAATQYYTEQALSNGLDIREPAVQATIVSSAAADANWQIFMGDNVFSKYMIQLPVSALRNGKFTGARTLANAMQFVMPIVKVSSNIAVHTARLGVGLPEAFIRLGVALHRGELADGSFKLSHEDAQAITRSFSAGALGLMLGAYAWRNPQYFGGAYDDQAPKNRTGLKPNEIRFFGHVLPAWINHAPELQWLNMVASARRVYDKYQHGTGTPNAILESLAFATMAPVKNLPFIDSYLRLFAGHETKGQVLGDMVRSAIIPGGKSIMDMFDSAQRHPKTFWQEMEMGIPILRRNVPAKGGNSTGVDFRQMSVK